MAEKTLHSLKINATRLGQRLSENLAEHSRDLSLIDSFASGTGGGSGKYLENGAVVTSAGIEETKRMLSSRSERERMEGLKRVMAMKTKNLPVTAFFPLMTSLLTPSTPLQARTLISLYIIHCASVAPELALLSINAYQKDLSDPNPIVRAGAIKTLSSMGLEDIRSLVGVAIAKGARDTSWYVRRAAADAVTALWKADPSNENRLALLPTLEVLLGSASALTVGSALSAWEELCPSRWTLIHPGYRKWCKMLMDVEEWGQVVLLKVLLRYGRTFFLDPARGTLDPDAELAIKSSEPLLQHMNPAVVLATVKLHYYLASPNSLTPIVRPLIRLLKSSPEVRAVILEDCAVVAQERPDLMVNYISDFFVPLSDPIASKRVRLRILVALANANNVRVLLREFLVYVKDQDEPFSADAISAIGTCAKRVPAVAPDCLKTLIKLSVAKTDAVIAQSVLVLRSLLRSPSFPATASRASIIQKLVLLMHTGRIQSPVARASVYWLVGQYAEEGLMESVGPDTVRLGAKGFVEESSEAKLQLLTLSAKLLVLSQLSLLTPNLRVLSLLFSYLTTLARYDLVYEVRDRARFLKGLLASAGLGKADVGRVGLAEEEFARGVEFEEQGEKPVQEEEERTLTGEMIKRVLFEGKETEVDSDGTKTGELGTFSLVLPTRKLAFSSLLPPYSTSVPPSSIRNVISVDAAPHSASLATSFSSRTTTPALRGFGSDSPRQGRSSPVVLVPTNFASGGNDSSRSVSVSPRAGNGNRKGFVDLEDFYQDSSEEEEDVEGVEGEVEADESDESEEEESESDEEESDDEQEEEAK